MENLLYNKTFKNLINILIGILIIFLAFSVFNITKDKDQDSTISVTGFAEINAKPDIAEITLTVISEDKDLGVASNENNQKINTIIAFLKENNIEDKDIKTKLYNINPRYEYLNDYKNRYLVSYEVNQSLNVKVRDLDSVGEIIEGATSRGANNISNLQFIIDNDELLKEQAREKAIEDAKSKAKKLEKELGISLKDIIGFYENTYTPVVNREYNAMKAMDSATMSAPSIQPGENNITSNVNIVYKIK